jgi:hypothetical protein
MELPMRRASHDDRDHALERRLADVRVCARGTQSFNGTQLTRGK